MMIAVTRGDDGRRVILLGMVRGNIDRLTAGKPIRASAESHPGFPADITVGIIFGETDADLEALIAPFVGDRPPPPAPTFAPTKMIGATGAYPYGKVDEHDEGELQMALATDVAAGIVRIIFGKPVAFLGLPSGEARELGKLLLDKADELDKSKA